MAVLLIENSQNKVEINKDEKTGDLYFEGIFALYGKRNLNNRIYPKLVMEKAVKEYNDNFIIKKRAMGCLDHDESASPELKNVAFIIEEPLIMKENGEVWGKATVIKELLPNGSNAYNLLKRGICIGVSSRGLGEIEEKTIFDEELNEDLKITEVTAYSFSCFDLVSEPSIGRFISPSKQEEKIEKKVENKIEEKKSFTNNDLLYLTKLLFKE